MGGNLVLTPKQRILWSFAEKKAEPNVWGLEANREVLAIGWFWIGFICQYKHGGEEWTNACLTFVVGLVRAFRIGKFHAYYDGPNCSLALGWLRFFWSGNPWTGVCKKCLLEEKETDDDE
jgi:hypothetical protein